MPMSKVIGSLTDAASALTRVRSIRDALRYDNQPSGNHLLLEMNPIQYLA